MARRDGTAIRKERISEIGRLVLKGLHQSSELSLLKTVALLQYEYGLTQDKIMEYLEILTKLGRFTIDKERDRIHRVENEEVTN